MQQMFPAGLDNLTTVFAAIEHSAVQLTVAGAFKVCERGFNCFQIDGAAQDDKSIASPSLDKLCLCRQHLTDRDLSCEDGVGGSQICPKSTKAVAKGRLDRRI